MSIAGGNSSIWNKRKPRRVRCVDPSCRWIGQRGMDVETGSYGVCRRCQGPIQPVPPFIPGTGTKTRRVQA